MPEGINQLRIGTAFLNGFVNNGLPRIPNTFQDTFILKTEIIEVKDKPSAPYELSADFFDNIDLRKRAIVAVGKQDTDVRFMYPIDERLEMIGMNSDHFVINITGSENDYAAGDTISFILDYDAMLRVMTSEHVRKEYIYD